MKTKDLQEFLKRGYLQTPYIIIRKFPTVYVQIPIHRWELKEHFSEGIFIHPAEEEILGYEEACHVTFELYHSKDPEADMCLVLDKDRARFISKDRNGYGRYVYGSVPWGGVLLTCGGEVMRFNESHYVL